MTTIKLTSTDDNLENLISWHSVAAVNGADARLDSDSGFSIQIDERKPCFRLTFFDGKNMVTLTEQATAMAAIESATKFKSSGGCSALETLAKSMQTEDSVGDSNTENYVNGEAPGTISVVTVSEQDSFQVIAKYEAWVTDEQIISAWAAPDGTGPCDCAHCQADCDCCGNASGDAIKIVRGGLIAERGEITVTQSWWINV